MVQFRDLLPLWVDVGASCSAALLFLAIGFVATWMARRLCRPVALDEHWTQRAKLVTEGKSLIFLVTAVVAPISGALTWLVVSGVMVPGTRMLRAVAVGGLVIAAGCYQLRRYLRVAAPEHVSGTTWQERIFSALVGSALWLVGVAMAVLGPAEFGWQLVLVHGLGLAVMVSVVGGFGVSLCRRLGVLQPADERLLGLVDSAGAGALRLPVDVVVLRSNRAQAYAIVWRRLIVVTTELMDSLTDNQVRSILRHEVGHLQESAADRIGRSYGLVILVVLGMWRFLTASLGWLGFLALLAIGWWLVMRVLKRSREHESHADEHALKQGDTSDEAEEGLHALALERVHEVNLIPAVTASNLATHPCLYDRMEACGVEPGYPRPEPLRLKMWTYGTVSFTSIILMVIIAVSAYGLSSEADEGPGMAFGALALRGGHPVDIEALGRAWKAEHPDWAAVALDAAASHPDVPGGRLPPAVERFLELD